MVPWPLIPAFSAAAVLTASGKPVLTEYGKIHAYPHVAEGVTPVFYSDIYAVRPSGGNHEAHAHVRSDRT